jgi:hypothetical protein
MLAVDKTPVHPAKTRAGRAVLKGHFGHQGYFGYFALQKP